jgi:hypothetical protein
MLRFTFYNPVEKNLSNYIKLSNENSISKFKERYSLKPPYKINYKLTLSDYENTIKNSKFNENKIVIAKDNYHNVNTNFLLVTLAKTLLAISITFVIYKNT